MGVIMGNDPLLVNIKTNLAVSSVKNLKIWSKKQKRCFHRVKSGFKRAKTEGKPIRFLTLTSKKGVPQKKLNDDFQILKKRIIRMTPLKLVKLDFIRANEAHIYFPSKPIGEIFEFEYCKVETSEGGGVLHILFKGDYIPRQWISDQWNEIHNGSWHVDIRLCKDYHASYVVNQYLSGQNVFERYSWSWGWVYKGFVKQWYEFRKYFSEPLIKWNLHMEGISIQWDDFKWLKPDGNFIDVPIRKSSNKKDYPHIYFESLGIHFKERPKIEFSKPNRKKSPDAYFSQEDLRYIPFVGCREQRIFWGGYK